MKAVDVDRLAALVPALGELGVESALGLIEEVRHLRKENLRASSEAATMRESLSATQARCTELLEEARALRASSQQTGGASNVAPCEVCAEVAAVDAETEGADLGGPVELTDEEAMRLHAAYERAYRVGPGGSPTAEADAVRALLRAAGRYVEPKIDPADVERFTAEAERIAASVRPTLDDAECERLYGVWNEAWGAANLGHPDANAYGALRAMLRAAGRYKDAPCPVCALDDEAGRKALDAPALEAFLKAIGITVTS